MLMAFSLPSFCFTEKLASADLPTIFQRALIYKRRQARQCEVSPSCFPVTFSLVTVVRRCGKEACRATAPICLHLARLSADTQPHRLGAEPLRKWSKVRVLPSGRRRQKSPWSPWPPGHRAPGVAAVSTAPPPRLSVAPRRDRSPRRREAVCQHGRRPAALRSLS
jgi:hypothetical protein